MPVVKRRRARRVSRRRRNPTTEVLAVNPRKRSYRRRSATKRRSYRRRRNPAELMELAANPRRRGRKRAYRKRYTRGSNRRNPRGIPVTRRQKRYIRRYARHRYSARSAARRLGLARGTMYKYSKFIKGKHRKWPRRKRARAATRSRRRRRTRSLKFRIPSGAKYGALKVAFNPAFSWNQLKTSAVAGLWGVGGFAVASFLTNTIAPKVKSGGLGISLGAITTDSIVATIIAAIVPFLPLHFKGKDALVAGCWVNAFARLAKDVLPTQTGITKYLPGSLGDFSQLSTYQPGMSAVQMPYSGVMQYEPMIDTGDGGYAYGVNTYSNVGDMGYSTGFDVETQQETGSDDSGDMFGTYGQ